jgi:hypothetical protein
MRFKVIDAATGDIQREFDDGHDASEWARAMNQTFKLNDNPRRFKVRREKVEPDQAWRDRERLRISDGTYTPAPWAGQSWYYYSKFNNLHFCHISKKDPGMVAFTESEEKGQQDLQLRMRAGKYLETYFPELDAPTRKFWVNKVKTETCDFNVEFAKTPDEIEWVYQNGPGSCMSKRLRDYNLPVHPTRIYGAGDLAVAWFKGDRDGNIVEDKASYAIARVLCWPEKKRYGRIYGDGGTMSKQLAHALEAMEYRPNGDFAGARLLRVKHGATSFICPFIDGNTHVRDDGEFLIIDNQGGYTARNQATGLAHDARHRCTLCNGPFVLTNAVSGQPLTHGKVGDHNLCPTCFAEKVFFCGGCRRPMLRGREQTALGKRWCPTCYERHFAQCVDCHTHTKRGEMRSTRLVKSKMNLLCGPCFAARDKATPWKQCESCGHYVEGALTPAHVAGKIRHACEFCLSDYPRCAGCQKHTFSGDMQHVIKGTQGVFFCQACTPHHSFICNSCGGSFHNDDRQKQGRWSYCGPCHKRRNTPPPAAGSAGSTSAASALGTLVGTFADSTTNSGLIYRYQDPPSFDQQLLARQQLYYAQLGQGQVEGQYVQSPGPHPAVPAAIRGGSGDAAPHPDPATPAPEQAGEGVPARRNRPPPERGE